MSDAVLFISNNLHLMHETRFICSATKAGSKLCIMQTKTQLRSRS